VSAYGWISLRELESWIPLARALDVSRVARSPRGFVSAYRRAKTRRNLSPQWIARREAFVARHLAQVRARRETLW